MNFFNKIGMMFRYMKTYGTPPKGGQILTTKTISRLIESEGCKTEKAIVVGKKSKAAFVIGGKSKI